MIGDFYGHEKPDDYFLAAVVISKTLTLYFCGEESEVKVARPNRKAWGKPL